MTALDLPAIPSFSLVPDMPLVAIDLVAVCHDCKHQHRYRETPLRFPAAMAEWNAKHFGHDIELLSPKRLLPKGFDDRLYEEKGEAPWWLDYKHNADLKFAFATSGAFTCTLASLATSATLVVGRESTVVDNSSNKYLDYLIGGKITTGTTPTVDKEIRVYAHGSFVNTGTFVDVLTGADAGATITNTYILDASLALLWSSSNSATSNIAYYLRPAGIAACFGGLMPQKFGLFVAHNTAVNLNSTGGNHVLEYTGYYLTSI